ncbi:hypothetical protein Poli38472_000102 [Pythium oligandrum]|uniref:SAM-dependent MTase RsmB/NOP-type domain-containing protein n=1 Tax=Pythium oligandrum TaxID=41045 RepID=A0A8K1FE24_PYTOL|nr:hypothetical protein Poli38472_000102 [Pythium oligandrum]|eukprot:TMW60060.1 hypothetical protein Poli38472_000102 [Pythium oligandrum]
MVEGVRAKDVKAEPRFVQYYLKQGIFPAEQLDEIKATLHAPLPSCFRVNPNSSSAEKIKELLTEHFPRQFQGATYEETAVTPPRELTWYPSKHSAWQLDCGKNILSKTAREHEGVREFREFLLFETTQGNITRQEAVSMIPALLLDIQREHLVLDMCAAPGSKTSQVMESLGQQGTSFEAEFKAQSGFIVANDANEKRGYMLVHQLQRMGLDTAVVTCHLGQEFPGLYVDGQLVRTNAFDRVICDVPCTGDGTIRKNKNIWGQWFPGGALSLHNIQLELGLRAAALLKPDGLMVYSTCSFNPIENEAIVAEMLRRADGALEVVDCTDKLAGLTRRPGMTEWKAAWLSRQAKAEMEWFDSYESVPTSLRGFRISHSMFPPEDDETREALGRCLRLFPTDQNTGGFFVTLLRKKHSLPGDLEQGLPSYEVATPRVFDENYECKLCGERGHPLRRCPKSWNGKKLAEKEAEKLKVQEEQKTVASEEPVEPMHGYTKLAPEHWDFIKEFYGITDGFPHEHLCSRSDGATSVCLVNENVQQACLAGRHLKVLNTGVRVFAKVPSGNQVLFRPTEEGMAFVLPFITKRKLTATFDDLDQLLASRVGGAVGLESFSSTLQEESTAMQSQSGVGPVVLVLDKASGSAQTPFALPVWLGGKTLGLLVDKSAQQQLQETLNRLR